MRNSRDSVCVSMRTMCWYECAFVLSIICMHACVKQIEPTSWSGRLSRSCIIPPRVQDSTLSLRVTHGEAAVCWRRTAGITSLSLSVTPALSPVMPPRRQAEAGWGAGEREREGGGLPVTDGDRLTGDR